MNNDDIFRQNGNKGKWNKEVAVEVYLTHDEKRETGESNTHKAKEAGETDLGWWMVKRKQKI